MSTYAFVTHLTVPFLNQQLRKVLVAETGGGEQSVGPVKIKMLDAELELLPGCNARLATPLTATAIGLSVRLRPVTEFVLRPEAGQARIEVTKLQIEGINIPRQWVEGFLRAYVADAEATLNKILGQIAKETDVQLGEIETTSDLLTLKFVMTKVVGA